MAIKEPLSIIGYGASTINGTSAEMTYAMQQADQKFFKKHEVIKDLNDNPATIGFAKYIPDDGNLLSRFKTLGKNALDDTISTLDRSKISNLNVLICLPEKRTGLPDNTESMLRNLFEEQLNDFSNVNIRFKYGGHSICAKITEEIAILTDEKTVCIVGGIDSYQSLGTLMEKRSNNELLTIENEQGVIFSEGAGFIALSNNTFAESQKGNAFAEVINIATAEEKDTFSKGKALTKVMKEVLKKIPKNSKCSRILHDMNKRKSALEFGCSYVRVNEKFADNKTIYRLSGSIGDVGTASIPLLIANAMEESRWGDKNEKNPMVVSLSDRGKSAILLETKRFSEVESYKIA